MRCGSGTAAFDLSDVEQEITRVQHLEHTGRRLLEQRGRAFAQGFTSALDGESSREWLDLYQEKSQ